MSIFRKSLLDQRWSIIGFGLALLIMSSTSVLLWPSVRDTFQNFDLPPAVKAFLGTQLSLATGAGYLSARYFGWTDILLIVYVVIQGTGTIAGEEGSGTLDLLLAQPLRRRDVVIQKTAAVVVGATMITGAGWIGFVITVPFVGIDVSVWDALVACVNMLPITLLFFALSLWSGVVAPSRGVASAMVIGLATAWYFISTLANGVGGLDWLKWATPFYYYGAGQSLVDGLVWWHVALLVGIASALIALATRSFERRDISIGAAEVDFTGMLRRAVA